MAKFKQKTATKKKKVAQVEFIIGVSLKVHAGKKFSKGSFVSIKLYYILNLKIKIFPYSNIQKGWSCASEQK